MKDNMSHGTIDRLTLYKRYLGYLLKENSDKQFITSNELGEGVQFNPATVRRDISHLGQLGQRKVGYNVRELCKAINKVMGLDKNWEVALVGAGNLGKALAIYQGFKKVGFKIVAIFDNAESKVNRKWKGIEVQDVKMIPEIIRKKKIKIAIIAVPFNAAQETADLLIESGIEAILNFAPFGLTVPDNIKLRNVDLATQLENLSYFLTRDKK